MLSNTSTRGFIAALIVLVPATSLPACATTRPSTELVDARKAYQKAAQSDVSELAPAELLDAKRTLTEAEAAHEEEPGGTLERTLGYVAERRVLLARAQSALVRERRRLASARESYETTWSQLTDENLAALEDARDSLGRTEMALALAEERIDDKDAEIEQKERQLWWKNAELATQRALIAQARRVQNQALENADAALSGGGEAPKVKENVGDIVVGLGGQIHFPRGESELSLDDKKKLDRIAAALKAAGEKSKVTVHGYTDSIGSPEVNAALSEQRAEAVRQYLVSRGVAASRVTAAGEGAKSPLAPNVTAEGRALNRRVDIAVSSP